MLCSRSVQAVVTNWKPYLSELESLPVSLKDRCLYLMTKRGWLNDDNIAVVSDLHTGKFIRQFGGIYAYCRYFIDRKL